MLYEKARGIWPDATYPGCTSHQRLWKKILPTIRILLICLRAGGLIKNFPDT